MVETDPPPVFQSVVDVVRHEDTRSSILSTSELQGWKLASKNNLEDDGWSGPQDGDPMDTYVVIIITMGYLLQGPLEDP